MPILVQRTQSNADSSFCRYPEKIFDYPALEQYCKPPYNLVDTLINMWLPSTSTGSYLLNNDLLPGRHVTCAKIAS